MRWMFLIFLWMASCSTADRSDTLRISLHSEPLTLDPVQAGDFISSTLICMIYDGLTRCSPDGSIEPAIASSYEVSEDKTVYLFHLRDAYWSDLTRVTAFDFENSWKRALSLPSPSAPLFYPIKNGEKCIKGEASLEEVGIKALNNNTLQVTLEKPTPYFYSLTAFPTFLPFKKEGIYNGPFQIKKQLQCSEILLSKNPTYWNCEHIALDKIHISIIPDEMTALQMFERGELDWIGGPLSPLPIDAMESLQNTLSYVPSVASTFCTFNTTSAPFQNPHLRQAFSYAINREKIVSQIGFTGQTPAQSILPPALSSQKIDLFNLEKAKELFSQALLEMQLDALEPLTLYYRSGQTEKILAQLLKQQWEKAFGIKIELVQLDIKTHTAKLQAKDYQIALSLWIAQFFDPVSLLDRFKNRENLKNYAGWQDETYLSFLKEEKYVEAENRLYEELPIAPIYHWNFPALQGPRLEATAVSPCGGILFERFTLRTSQSAP
jgi:oligopeptide transport system substrate-binding protein